MADVSIMVTHRVHGFHYWSAAPDEVAYLRARHRHLFLIIVSWAVKHDDRDVEFHIAQQWIRDVFPSVMDFGSKSCEMIARDLHSDLVAADRPAPRWVEVWEDDENGARVEFE